MKRLPSLALLALLPAFGCATVVGTVVGPVTTNISFFEHNFGAPDWAKILGIPVVAPLGVAFGFWTGLEADVGYVYNGEYGEGRWMPFEAVFDPANPIWGSEETWVVAQPR